VSKNAFESCGAEGRRTPVCNARKTSRFESIAPIKDTISTSITHIKDLVPDNNNRRLHNSRNIGMIVDALHQVGAARSIVIDEDDVILAGNGVTEAAAEAGITKLRVIEASGDELIAVRRRGLTAEQKRALAMYDNRTAELAEWDADRLQADLAAGLDLKPWFSDEELAKATRDATAKGGLTDPDDVPAERATDIKLGDLFELGQHRLLCGDSTKAEDVARVMGGEKAAMVYADPPYGYDKGIANDEHVDAALSVYGLAMKLADVVGSVWAVVDTPKKYIREFIAASERSGWRTREPVLHMYRNSMANGVYGTNIFELSFVYCQGKPKVNHRHLNAVDVSRKAGSDNEHPTQKFVSSYEHFVEMFSPAGAIVYDPFLGSGTTLIACEQLGRKCRAIEISPQYCQVTIDRFEQFTGQKAVKVAEAVRG